MQYVYRANGLTIASEFELPELTPHEGQPDVVIRLGRVPERLSGVVMRGPLYQVSAGQYLLHLPRIARYWVCDGQNVTVAPENGVAIEDIRVFILSSIMGVLAHQNGFLPIHASAIHTPHGCVLFAGDSGAGKSTLAAAFQRRGYPLIADDICAISLDDVGQPIVHPGYRHLKLWGDSLARVGALGPARRLRVGMEKFSVMVPSVAQTPVPVHRIYMLSLQLAEDIELRPLRGRSKVALIRKDTYRLRIMRALGQGERHFEISNALARDTAVIQVDRPHFLEDLPRLVARLESDMTDLALSTP